MGLTDENCLLARSVPGLFELKCKAIAKIITYKKCILFLVLSVALFSLNFQSVLSVVAQISHTDRNLYFLSPSLAIGFAETLCVHTQWGRDAYLNI